MSDAFDYSCSEFSFEEVVFPEDCERNEESGTTTVYNLTVEGLHTYVAGGIRVHNTSGYLGRAGNLIDDVAFDPFGIGSNIAGNILTRPLHDLGKKISEIENPLVEGAVLAGIGGLAAVGTGLVSAGIHLSAGVAGAARALAEGDLLGAVGTLATSIVAAGASVVSGVVTGAGAVVAGVGKAVGAIVDAVGDFFGGLFGDRDETSDRSKPIVIDLDGDGIEIAPMDENYVLFDADGDTFAERTAWVGSDDGILVWDENSDGKAGKVQDDNGDYVGEAHEVVLADLTSDDDTDLEALRTVFDSNNDGTFDANDDKWNEFRIWQDADGDGEVDAGEMQSLSAHGITAIGLSYSHDEAVILRDGSIVEGFLDVTRNGETILAGDVSLKYATFGLRTETRDGHEITVYEGATGSSAGETGRRILTDGERDFSFSDLGQVWTAAVGSDAANNISAYHEVQDVLIEGGSGNDRLLGGFGNDILIGGSGSDKLLGGVGADVLVVDSDDLSLTSINDEDLSALTTLSNIATLEVSNGVDGGEGYDTLVIEGAVGANITLSHHNVEAVVGSGGNDVLHGDDDNLTAFSSAASYNDDGEAVPGYLPLGYHLEGGDGSDQITGARNNDRLLGGSGNDILVGNAGDDYIDGGTGADLVSGGAGSDTIVVDAADTIASADGSFLNLGGEGYDTIVLAEGFAHDNADYGTLGFEAVVGNELDNVIGGMSDEVGYRFSGGSGDDTITAAGGNDRLFGGEGDDTLSGGSGIDTYFFRRGDGQDVITDHSGLRFNGGARPDDLQDTIQFGEGISFRDLRFSRSGNDLQINILNGADDADDRITVSDWYHHDSRVEFLKFSQGELIQLRDPFNPSAVVGIADQPGILTRYYVTEEKPWLADLDLAEMTPVKIEYIPELRMDVGGGTFWEDGPSDHVVIVAEMKFDAVLDGSYEFQAKADDEIMVLVNGRQVSFDDVGPTNATKNGSIRLDAGAHTIQVLYTERTGDAHLHVAVNGPGMGWETLGSDHTPAFDWVDPATASLHTDDRPVIVGNFQDDWIDGNLIDLVEAADLADDPILRGAGGDDTIVLATSDYAGWQTGQGDAGRDTYIVSSDAGSVEVVTQPWDEDSRDLLRFLDLVATDLRLSSFATDGSSEDLTLEWGSLDDESDPAGRLTVDFAGLEAIRFADGTSISSLSIDENGRMVLGGTESHDVIAGGLTYGEGRFADDSVLHGMAGDDILIAGPSDWADATVLIGGDDHDRYVVGRESGTVLVQEDGVLSDPSDTRPDGVYAGDELVFSDLSLADLNFSRQNPGAASETLTASWGEAGADGAGQVVVEAGASTIEAIEFSDGLRFERGTDESPGVKIFGGSFTDIIVKGSTSFETLFGTEAWGAVRAGGGADWLIGDGADDEFHGENGNDRLAGGTGADKLYGGHGNDVLHGGGGADVLDGGTGDDVFWNVTGQDTVIGGDGIDVALIEGIGSEYASSRIVRIDGDVYFGHPTSGLVKLGSDTEWLSFADGISYSLNGIRDTDFLEYIASHGDLITHVNAVKMDIWNATTMRTWGEDHYLASGWIEGRMVTFNGMAYNANHADLMAAFGDDRGFGALHYISEGYEKGRDTTTFNVHEYVAANADLALAFGTDLDAAISHYILHGHDESRETVTNFDPLRYIASNADLILAFGGLSMEEAKAVATQHYGARVSSGLEQEAERPHDSFSVQAYLALEENRDVAAVFGEDLERATWHYIQEGFKEGREAGTASTSGIANEGEGWSEGDAPFDPLVYVASNPDLIDAYGHLGEDALREAGLRHFALHGHEEGRAIDFDSFAYALQTGNPARAELWDIFGDDPLGATLHFIKNGRAEGLEAPDPIDLLAYVAGRDDLIAHVQGSNLRELDDIRHFAAEHYHDHGRAEGYDGAGSFDAAQYRANYADLQLAFGDDPAAATMHYIWKGYDEGRSDALM